MTTPAPAPASADQKSEPKVSRFAELPLELAIWAPKVNETLTGFLWSLRTMPPKKAGKGAGQSWACFVIAATCAFHATPKGESKSVAFPGGLVLVGAKSNLSLLANTLSPSKVYEVAIKPISEPTKTAGWRFKVGIDFGRSLVRLDHQPMRELQIDFGDEE